MEITEKIKNRVSELDAELGRQLALKSQLTSAIADARARLKQTETMISSINAAIGELNALTALT